MRKLLALVAMLPCAAFAQSVPNMARPVTLAGPTGLQAAMGLKADVANGTLSSPTITGGSFSSPTITGGAASSIAISGSTLATPTITGGKASGTDVSATAVVPTGATNSVAPALGLRRIAVYPDDYKSTADGTDDAPSIQRAMNYICTAPGQAASGGNLALMARVYELDSSVNVPCTVNMYGQGWEEQMQLGSGTWLHITSKLSGSDAFNVTTTLARASEFSDFAITEDHATPSTTAGTSWSPTSYPAVFNLNGVGAAVFFRHILWDGIYQGIYANGAGRIELDGMYGDIFDYLVAIDGSEDVDRIRNVHIWPYWTNSLVSGSAATPAMTQAQQNNVEAYRIANANAIILNRVDTPFMDEVFTIGLHSAVAIGYTSNGNLGTTTKLHLGRISCDMAQYCLWVMSAVTSQASAIIDQMDYHGENPFTTGAPNSGGAMVELDGNASLQIGQMFADMVGSAIFNMPNSTVCSEVHVGSLKVNWTNSPSNVVMAYMPKCGASSYDLMTLINYSSTNNSGGGPTTLTGGVGHLMMPTLSEQNSSAQ